MIVCDWTCSTSTTGRLPTTCTSWPRRCPPCSSVRAPSNVGVEIDGAVLLPLTSHPDERGSFTEVYRRSWLPGGKEMVQGNLSFSKAGVLRGLHFHRRQADYWFVVQGTAFV